MWLNIDRIKKFYKRHSIYEILFSVLLGGLLINLLANYLPPIFGFINLFIFIFIAALFLVCIGVIHFYLSSRKKFEPDISRPLEKQYKGLIVSISRTNESKKDLIDKINAVNKGLEDVNKLYEIRGIGQAFRAIMHHLGTLEVCWLLYTNESKDGKEIVEHFINKFGSGVVTKPIFLEKPFDIKSTYKIINEIYVKGLEEVNLREKEVIADITGGTTPMSGAIILACNASSDRDIEYIEQNNIELIEIEHT